MDEPSASVLLPDARRNSGYEIRIPKGYILADFGILPLYFANSQENHGKYVLTYVSSKTHPSLITIMKKNLVCNCI